MYKSELFTCWQEGLMPRDVLLGKKQKRKMIVPEMSQWPLQCPDGSILAERGKMHFSSPQIGSETMTRQNENWIRNDEMTKCKLNKDQ